MPETLTQRAIAEFARVLRPGGRLALTAWARPAEHRLAGVFLDALAEARAVPPAGLPPGPDFFRFSDDEAFAAALRQQGLASLGVTDITFVQRFASADSINPEASTWRLPPVFLTVPMMSG